jgi:3'(2'), 5'-bisphosphate nucleotidase
MLDAVRKALQLCREVQLYALRSVDKSSADDISPVTIADYGAQAILSRTLQEYFPDDGILAEESSHDFLALVEPEQRSSILNMLTEVLDENITLSQLTEWLDYGQQKPARRLWTLDPIDGTRGFIALRHYSVGVGILTDGVPTGGIIGCPAFGVGILAEPLAGGMLFYVQDGKAYRQPIEGGTPVEIHVSAHRDPSEVILVQSVEERHGNKERKAAVYQQAGFGNSRLYELDSMEKYALMAAGHADVCLHIPLKTSTFHVWDHAPGAALLTAAGGNVCGLDGKPLDFSQGRVIPCDGVIMTNGAVHDTIVSATQAVMSAARAAQE